ncbi:DUF3341 domain-containing protein [Pseudomonas sp. 681]|uniref:DUF3341 domain-containing protein n=1 Tax=Pseudomonas fungipugnans TaxID=3024217 RepID=A0ABT6QGZ7_9PSED|nr:DUF3341 domain-containing protein [Pseudomonas sp. 681]MDI2590131.1 DUF3341 domain-containing protein [Pseudomonas sp. 681]
MSEALGLLAEFNAAEPLEQATRQACALGYRQLDAFAPFPLESLEALLAPKASWVPWMASVGAVSGIALALLMQIGTVLAYPLNIGGRPMVALPAFMVVTFLFAVVFAAGAAVLALLIGSRLPRLHHPLFAVEGFERGGDDRFLLFIAASDPLFDPVTTRDWLQQRALAVREVAA